jgi:hypothetical protein
MNASSNRFRHPLAGVVCSFVLLVFTACNKGKEVPPQAQAPACLLTRIDYGSAGYELREFDANKRLKSIVTHLGGEVSRATYTWDGASASYSVETDREPNDHPGVRIIPSRGTIQLDAADKWVSTTTTGKDGSNVYSNQTSFEYTKEGSLSKLTTTSTYYGTTTRTVTTFEYSQGNLTKAITSTGGSTKITTFEYYLDKVAYPTNPVGLFGLITGLWPPSRNMLKKTTESYSNSVGSITRYSYRYNEQGLPIEATIEYQNPNPDAPSSYAVTNAYAYQCD